MIYENILTVKTVSRQGKKESKKKYFDDIISLDFETSSIFNIDDKWQQFNKNIPTQSDLKNNIIGYDNIDKAGIVYAFGISINDNEYIGRDLFELKMILHKISSDEGIRIIYIHNLAFDFHFLMNIIDDFEVFARKPHAPIKCFSPSLNIEFRCSYFLTGYGLERYAEIHKFDIKKAVGTLDYTKVRHSKTPLTEVEQEYILIDIRIVTLIIKQHLNEYRNVFRIPLTKTGKVRERVKKLYTYYDKQKISKEIVDTFFMFKLLADTFVGGYTHGNSLYINEILKDVLSQDLKSSYPAVMLQCKFPRSKFQKMTVTEKDIFGDNYCVLMKVAFYNLKSSLTMTYLSESKAITLKGETIENGRVVQADYCEYYLTDIDFQIISYAYADEKRKLDYEIIESYVAYAGYLPIQYRKFIVELYKNKETLKGIEDFEDVYMRSKEDINSLYGMTVTNTIRDEVHLNSLTGDWTVKSLEDDEVNKRIKKMGNNAYISFSWGLWITANARKRLWDMIKIINEDVVYSDTDSIKYINGELYENDFNNFNDDIRKVNKKISSIIRCDYEIIKNIGTFDYEGKSDKFITFGAKKYGTEKDGKISVTISGLNKRKAVNSLKTLDDLKIGKVWGYDESGRTEVVYNSLQNEMIITDYLGNTLKVNQKFGVCIKPTTYKLSLSDDFEEYVNMVKSTYTSTKLSQLGYERENSILSL